MRREQPMGRIILCLVLIISCLPIASAGEIQEIELRDGSTISGEVLSLSNGIYTIKSDILGMVKLEESKIRSVKTRSSSGSAGSASDGSGSEVRNLQDRMMSDQQIMGLIQSLQNNPDFKNILDDPEIMKAVSANDIAALMANPKFMKLLNDPTVQEIGKKVK
jgi:hypothetical protein